MKEFTGRFAELNFLEQYYHKTGNRIVVVYGSKGVGKTRLLQEFCKDKIFFYYLARACSEREQCCQWAGELRESGKEISKYPDYEELLQVSLDEKSLEKQVLIIDEFHHMLKGESVFFQKLTEFMEKRLMSRPALTVLCTSASGWVENHLVGKIGSKVSEIGGFLKVRELPFGDIRKLFPDYSLDDSIKAYSVLGGVPGYWMNFSERLSTPENIVKNLINSESRLYGEMNAFLERELREPGVYNTILTAMARDCNKLNDIFRHTGFSRAKISVYLKNLMELDLVEKVYSYDTEGRANAQKGIYRIANAYVRFYFRYLFPNQSMLQQLEPETFYDKKIAPSFDLYVEETYRKICREQLNREYRVVGEWLGKTGNIDVVASDGQGHVGTAACVYSKVMKYEDYEWLLFSMKKAKLHCEDIRLFCDKGFDERLMQAAEEGIVKLCSIKESEG